MIVKDNVPVTATPAAARLTARETGNRLAYGDGLVLTSAIECGNGDNLTWVGPGHFMVDPSPDEIPVSEAVRIGYTCVQLTNERAEPRQVKIDIVVPPLLIERNWTHCIKHPYHVKRGEQWAPLPAENCITGASIFRVVVPVAAHESVLVSSSQPYPYSAMSSRMHDWASGFPDRSRLRSIGRTAQGRDIWGLTLGLDETAPRVFVHGTPQPTEVGAVAAEGIIEYLLSDDPMAERLLRQYQISVVPQPNPDGVVLGRMHVNSKHQLVGYGYNDAAAGNPEAPEECQAVWQFVEELRPVLLLDLHGLFHAIADRPTLPYLFDRELHSSEKVRTLVPQLDKALIALDPDGAYRYIEKDRFFWSGMLTYQARLHFDSLAYLYDMWGLGASGTKSRAVAVLQTMLSVWAQA